MYRRLAALPSSARFARGVLAGASLSLAALPVASCDNGTAATAVDYSTTLATLTDTVVVPEMQTLATDADALVTALKAFDASPTASTLATAQSAWRTARADWRKLDAVYFGPTLDLGISDRVDASPADTATIESSIAGTAMLDDTFVGNAGGKTKGFLGDEYLIFSTKGASAALTTLTGSDGARRRQLAISIADEIASSAHQLSDAWTKGYTSGATTMTAYATLVKTAGAGSTRYPKQLTAITDFVNGVANALDGITMRLRAALGNGTPAPSTDPTSASDSTVADLNASLAGATAIWGGLSTKVSSSSMVSEANGDDTTCGQKVTAIPAPFDTALTAQTSIVQAAYTSCDAWKVKWATDVTAALGVVLSSDQDGD